ncbi:MAG: right-handed parallel beta-helix repeat-containing protein [Deltaproteobacteria bacterium]|nr:right-handed parallel beta-helix repeat-containing protein [Deltaproteobacteria bacterium]
MIVIIVCLTAVVAAADWHVAPAPDGVDGAAGSQAAPLATLAHAVSRAGPGDRILLRRDGSYRVDNLDLGGDLSVTAYGSGADPIVTAAFEIDLPNTWAQNNNVRSGPIAEPVLACYVDGRFVPLARYPDTGFLRIDNDDDPDQIVDSDLALRPGVAAGRWTGAQVRWRRWSWWWETRPIDNHSAVDTLELGPEGRFDSLISDPGSGYFIDNDLDELDAPGEWFWGGGTLYVYPPSWADPDTMRVEVVTTAETGLLTSGTSLSSVQFQRFAGLALQIGRPATIEDCTFAEIETDAIRYTWDAQPFTIRRSIFKDIRNVAIQGWANDQAPSGSLIERNLFLRIGMQPGYGGSGSWHAAGVILGNANSAVFRLNRLVDSGYAGIILGSDGQTVERNVFVRSMGTLNDGAAVYTNCNASIIRENIILDTIGNLETSHPWYPLGHGIWPEFLEDFRDSDISFNTIYGSNGHGIMLPNNFSCTISSNVTLDNRRAGLGLSGDDNDQQDHMISQNTLAVVSPTRRIQLPENLSQWWLPPYDPPTPVALEYEPAVDYGLMTATTFIAPLVADVGVIRPDGASDIDNLTDWVNAAAWASADNSLVVRKHAILLFNDTENAKDMPVPAGTWSLPDGSAVSSPIRIESFRSVVLVSDNPVGNQPPYYAASGIDWRADVPTDDFMTPEPDGGFDGGPDAGQDAGPDGSDPGSNAGVDGGPQIDAGDSSDAGSSAGETGGPVVGKGCGCSTTYPNASLFLVFGLLALLRRRTNRL